jgi:hypothetical protein
MRSSIATKQIGGLFAVVAIFGPIPHIAMLLIEPPRIGLEAVDKYCHRPIIAHYAISINEIAVIVGLVR